MFHLYVTIQDVNDLIRFDLRYHNKVKEKAKEEQELEWFKENLFLHREYFDLLVKRKIFRIENKGELDYVPGPINRKIGAGMNVKHLGSYVHFDLVFAPKINKLWENIAVSLLDLRVTDVEYQEMVYRLRALSQFKFLGKVEDITEAIQFGENERIEFKRDFIYSRGKVVKSIVAFANTNNGNLFLGIADDGQVYGIDHEIARYKNEDQYLLAVTNYLQEKIFPILSPFPLLRLIQVGEQKVLHIFIQAGKQLYTFFDQNGEKHVAVRANNRSQTIRDPHEIGALYMERTR